MTWDEFAAHVKSLPDDGQTRHISALVKIEALVGLSIDSPLTRQELYQMLLENAADSLSMYTDEHNEAENDMYKDITGVIIEWQE